MNCSTIPSVLSDEIHFRIVTERCLYRILFQVSQNGGFSSDHDWSFVIYYNNPYNPQVLIENGDPSTTGLMKDQVLMINLFPQLPENSYSSRNEVIFVVDRSGKKYIYYIYITLSLIFK